MNAVFFPNARALRAWFETNHAAAHEIWIGYFKRGPGPAGVTYAEAVEEALCYGWIDGQVRRIDDARYANRYSPRSSRSPWSQINVRRARELIRSGRMRPAGLRAFLRRDPHRGYSYERKNRRFSPRIRERFLESRSAWRFFQDQPAHYRRTVMDWVMSAKRETTRDRRFAVLLEASTEGRRVDLIAPFSGRPRALRAAGGGGEVSDLPRAIREPGRSGAGRGPRR